MVNDFSVRYEKVRSEWDDSDEGGSDSAGPAGEGDGVTAMLRPTSARRTIQQKERHTWVRVAAALVFLTVALGLVFCELHGCLQTDNDFHNHSASAGDIWNSETKEGQDHHDDGGDGDHHHGDTGNPEDHSHLGEEADEHADEHHSSLYHHGVVITDSAVCSGVGRGILVDGGSAADAGIAALLCLGVVHPQTAGVGGVFSAIHYNGTSGISKAIQSLCPETPSTMYGVPATLQTLKLLHQHFGNLNYTKLFESAIRLAKDGFSIDESLARALKRNQAQIHSSRLCDLFCDENGAIKGEGSNVTNHNLSELLRSVSVLMLNDAPFPETLAMKLAADLPQIEQQDFVRNVQRCGGEINDPLIVEKETYTVFTAASPVSGRIISDVLKEAGEQNLSLWSVADLNSTASSYINLLNSAKLIYSNSLPMEHQSPGDLFALNTAGSHIGVLDSSGNVLIISASLNSSFGSKRFLPSTGVTLSDVTMHSAASSLSCNCPSVLKLKSEDEILGIGVTGGMSVPFLVAQIIVNAVHFETSFRELLRSPLLHVGMTGPESFLVHMSGVSNSSALFQLLLDREPELRATNESIADFLGLILDSHAGHVGAIGIPAANAYTDGY
ncbi:glutathione hydrolase 6 [Amia ocellicauda]|uniref:glutathione hydrolase 6 n=1 Tax=Amia ocellicauda TaxID=2972642 RepID=UPI0034644885